MNDKKEQVNFGFTPVSKAEKTERVQDVFSDVASYYDIMNDVMSFGLHRLWKDSAINILNPKPDQKILDLAAGTGDLTSRVLCREPNTEVIMADLNEAMLREGQENLYNNGYASNFSCVRANAECLPFDDESFDKTMISFGIRNVSDLEKALSELYRVTKSFGQCLIMEFSLPQHDIPKAISKAYLDYILPIMGQVIAGDKKSYEYLGQSIQQFPDAHAFKHLLLDAGFDHVRVHTFMMDNVKLHQCFKTTV